MSSSNTTQNINVIFSRAASEAEKSKLAFDKLLSAKKTEGVTSAAIALSRVSLLDSQATLFRPQAGDAYMVTSRQAFAAAGRLGLDLSLCGLLFTVPPAPKKIAGPHLKQIFPPKKPQAQENDTKSDDKTYEMAAPLIGEVQAWLEKHQKNRVFYLRAQQVSHEPKHPRIINVPLYRTEPWPVNRQIIKHELAKPQTVYFTLYSKAQATELAGLIAESKDKILAKIQFFALSPRIAEPVEDISPTLVASSPSERSLFELLLKSINER